jgi:hypothetical protein
MCYVTFHPTKSKREREKKGPRGNEENYILYKGPRERMLVTSRCAADTIKPWCVVYYTHS